MTQRWKLPPIVKGMLTYVPVLNSWRQIHASTGGTDTARYCYSVWLRHLVTLSAFGFRVAGARLGELGPGDSVGIGVAALLSGGAHYVGLDVVPFSAKADLENIFEELLELYVRREPIPDDDEFPRVLPKLNSYAFPNELVDWQNLARRAKELRADVRANLRSSRWIDYSAPWTSPDIVTGGSLDLFFSQAVLEHVDGLEETYHAMSTWMKPGGYASHVIDFTSHELSPFWNGHWAYSDIEWQLVRGRREFLLNREPLSTHLACLQNVGLQVISLKQQTDINGLGAEHLSGRFRSLDPEDLRTSGVILVLRKL